ncbi:glycosyltransferase family 1 protein [Methanohalophilus sp. RSK]|uniref:glycosyltransferase family 4 protein n=1 Tax=Methanohalophilus sp. RSK TaxID=2485783 RepID=UPI000F43AA2E|nr:glycosyltransferase family 4 protein [Methanohalophilus sp. RSK]RNI15768.1 glycosyltransferase family 1 protein [Methanohalophilus sp. RSK]
MKICMIGLFPLPGRSPSVGPDNVVYNLMKYLPKEKEDIAIDVVSIRDDIDDYFINAISSNVRIHYFPRIKYIIRSIGDAIIVRNFLKTHKFDIIHSHSPIALSFVMGTKTPKVVTLHGMYHLERKHVNLLSKQILNYNLFVLKRRIIPKLDGFVAISPYVIDELKHIGVYEKVKNIFQINNPMDESFFNVPQNYRDNIIFYPATITKRKNQLAAINAIELIKDDINDVKIIFTGGFENTYLKEVKNTINEKKLTSVVEYRGRVTRDEILELYRKASIVYLLSNQETQPMAVIEAMATGTPVIASNIKSNEFLIEDGVTGYIINPNDSEKIA